MMLDSLPYGRGSVPEDDPMSTGGKVTLAALCVLGLVAGWHYYNHTHLEDALRATANEYLREHWPAASAHVEINPLSNFATIRVERKPVKDADLFTILAEALVGNVRAELEPQLDRQLELAARRAMDVYAMALPYRVSIVVEEPNAGLVRAGWNQAALSAAAQGCVASILDSARHDYLKRARSAENRNPRAFPDELVRGAFSPICTCITNETAKRFTLVEYQRLPPERLKPFLKEISGPEHCNMERAVERMLAGLIAELP